ncbi:hypothetical protein VOLCADRAFT_95705 [Volvox carteri f. nagariensis]|uniref:Pherophorin domain-containing protein n=1 Tax=Volvox carteri f. nagariensis TaxID=3068 RepID=D8U863_VOLCA|nr:uncharacterized protein VOLCADRAFT_95705 [Volvox carteri f. nagariensis]EFJ44034.1 hypothetical protein VOLCADRAFT_95705 [Volvox carteri f. nagariensis]|eukprot:XP_002954835.1 hypothetical protein VOLCADRAFT_95705 [Volvox carteri f. nagariensis]
MGTGLALVLVLSFAVAFYGAASANDEHSATPINHPGRGLLATTSPGFPWCKCETYDCTCNPYTLIPLQPNKRLGFVRTCFRVAYIGCDPNLACCRGLTDSVQKFSLDTNPQCANTANIYGITVNGQMYDSWDTHVHDTGYELKIYNLQASNATFPGSTICVLGYPACSTWADLCRGYPARGCRYSIVDTDSNIFTFGNGASCSELGDLIIADTTSNAAAVNVTISVPFTVTECSSMYDEDKRVYPLLKVCGAFLDDGRGDFDQLEITLTDPMYGLQAWVLSLTGGVCPYSLKGYSLNTSRVPYTVGNFSISPTTLSSGDGNIPSVSMCFTVGGQSCDPRYPCCHMDFAKVEIPISSVCKPAVQEIRVAGKKISYSWSFYEEFVTLKFTGLPMYLPQPVGAQICWNVAPGACADPAKFCLYGRCQVNIYSGDNKCCPATFVYPSSTPLQSFYREERRLSDHNPVSLHLASVWRPDRPPTRKPKPTFLVSEAHRYTDMFYNPEAPPVVGVRAVVDSLRAGQIGVTQAVDTIERILLGCFGDAFRPGPVSNGKAAWWNDECAAAKQAMLQYRSDVMNLSEVDFRTTTLAFDFQSIRFYIETHIPPSAPLDYPSILGICSIRQWRLPYSWPLFWRVNQITEFVAQPGQVLTVIGTGVPQTASFFIAYILFNAFIVKEMAEVFPPCRLVVFHVVRDERSLAGFVQQHSTTKRSLEDLIDFYAARLAAVRRVRRRQVLVLGPLLGQWGVYLYGVRPVRVDELLHLRTRLEVLYEQLRAGLAKVDELPYVPTAFLTFGRRWDAAVVFTALHDRDEALWWPTPAPHPGELLWGNLRLRLWQISWRTAVARTAFMALLLSYTVPLSALQGLMQSLLPARANVRENRIEVLVLNQLLYDLRGHALSCSRRLNNYIIRVILVIIVRNVSWQNLVSHCANQHKV